MKMNIVKKSLLISALTLPIMAQSCTDQLRATLIQTCDGLREAYSYYDEVAASGALSNSTMSKVAFTRGQTDKLCADPANATPLTITRVAANAYVVLNAAFREGGQYGPAVKGYVKVQGLKKLLLEARRN